MTTYPTFHLDQNHPAGSSYIAGISQTKPFLIVSGENLPWPVIECKDESSSSFLTYATRAEADAALERVESACRLPELQVYDRRAVKEVLTAEVDEAERAMTALHNAIEQDYCEEALEELLFAAGGLETVAQALHDTARTHLSKLEEEDD